MSPDSKLCWFESLANVPALQHTGDRTREANDTSHILSQASSRKATSWSMLEHAGLISVRDQEVGGFRSTLAQLPSYAELLAEFLTDYCCLALQWCETFCKVTVLFGFFFFLIYVCFICMRGTRIQ